MTYTVTIISKQRLRKSKVETFVGVWGSIEEVKQVIEKYRPNALIIAIYRSELVYDLTSVPLSSVTKPMSS